MKKNTLFFSQNKVRIYMPVMSNRKKPENLATDDYRFLCLKDQRAGITVYCHFSLPKFGEIETDAVEGLFESSVNVLQHPSTLFFAPAELPILNSIGPFRKTLVERSKKGVITVKDISGDSIDGHIAAGN